MDLDFVSVHKHAKKELGQYAAILTSHLVNNPYVSALHRHHCLPVVVCLEPIWHLHLKRIKLRDVTGDGNVIPRKTVSPTKSFRDVTCLPVTRITQKKVVTKENPNMATGAPTFVRITNLLIWRLWYQFPLEAYFLLVGLDLEARKMSTYRTLKWKPRLMQLWHWQQPGKLFRKTESFY